MRLRDAILEDIKDAKSVARLIFDRLPGDYMSREVRLEKPLKDNVADLEKRPAFTPYIRITETKRNGDDFYALAERLYTNNDAIGRIEHELRSLAREVKAEGFEDTPVDKKEWFNTDFSLVPVDITRTSLTALIKGRKVEHREERLEGVDFDSKCTLRMIPPEEFLELLREMEKQCDYSVCVYKTTERDIRLNISEGHFFEDLILEHKVNPSDRSYHHLVRSVKLDSELTSS